MKIKTKRYYLYILAAMGAVFIAAMPLKMSLWLADIVGSIIFKFGKKHSDKILENLKLAFPEKSESEIEKIAKGVFSNICKNAVELINTYKLRKKIPESWIEAEGFEKIKHVLSGGKGALVLASHIGNWELIPMYFAFKGYRPAIIARRLYFNRYNDFIAGLRKSWGIEIIYRDDSPRRILKVLKENRPIGILADQDVDSVDGVFVDFFGRPAYTPSAPVALGLASGASIVPCFLIRQKKGHKLIIADPIKLVEGRDKEETIKINTQKWSQVVESYIRKYPEQWVWMHKRWKTKQKKQ